MADADYDEVVELIKEQLEILLQLRRFFPAMDESMEGSRVVDAPPLYENLMGPIKLRYAEPLTKEAIQQHGKIAHWVNQAFPIKLYALLESRGVTKDGIDTCLDGGEDLRILKKLRGILAHSSGRYNPDKKDHRKLLKWIIERYVVEKGVAPGEEFPLAINEAIRGIAGGCIRYVQALAKQKKQDEGDVDRRAIERTRSGS